MTAQLLGHREDQETEFKAADALRDPSAIAREVVGMLNAGGGVVFIGIDEQDGEAVAINPVGNPKREADRLLDFLVDTLDPSPTAEEVVMESISVGSDRAVLAVRVNPRDERRPYFFRKGGGLLFLRRVGARNQPMSRQEIAQAFEKSSLRLGPQALDLIKQKLVEARQKVQESRDSGLWLGMRPVKSLVLDPEDPRLEEIASDPLITGNRRSGWHFARSSRRPQVSKDRLEWGLWSEIRHKFASQARVARDGTLEFWASLERFHWKGEERELWPVALLEYPISAFRIARIIYRESLLSREDQIAVHLTLFGVDGWVLRRGSPGDGFFTEDPVELKETGDLVFGPECLKFRRIDEEPDRCGFDLVRRIYHAFGLLEADIPRVFDRESGNLVLRD